MGVVIAVAKKRERKEHPRRRVDWGLKKHVHVKKLQNEHCQQTRFAKKEKKVKCMTRGTLSETL